MKINFTNETNIDVKKYIKIIKKVLKKERTKMFFNVIFVDDEYIRQINKQYRNIDRVTDVITFALMDNPDEILPGTEYELGDVFICINQALRQAIEYGHSVEREIGFLATHGYLHLLGYDHIEKEDEEEMFKKQEEILEKAKLRRK